MAIFNSYVKLPEGRIKHDITVNHVHALMDDNGWQWMIVDVFFVGIQNWTPLGNCVWHMTNAYIPTISYYIILLYFVEFSFFQLFLVVWVFALVSGCVLINIERLRRLRGKQICEIPTAKVHCLTPHSFLVQGSPFRLIHTYVTYVCFADCGACFAGSQKVNRHFFRFESVWSTLRPFWDIFCACFLGNAIIWRIFIFFIQGRGPW